MALQATVLAWFWLSCSGQPSVHQRQPSLAFTSNDSFGRFFIWTFLSGAIISHKNIGSATLRGIFVGSGLLTAAGTDQKLRWLGPFKRPLPQTQGRFTRHQASAYSQSRLAAGRPRVLAGRFYSLLDSAAKPACMLFSWSFGCCLFSLLLRFQRTAHLPARARDSHFWPRCQVQLADARIRIAAGSMASGCKASLCIRHMAV